MLDQTQPANVSGMTCPLPIPEPLPEMTKQQGREIGQAEAKQALEQAEQHKGAPLTKSEMQEAIHLLFLACLEEMEMSDKPKEWYNGWYQGCAQALREASRTAAPELPTPMVDRQPDGSLVTGTVTIRRAVIETESIDVLANGIMCGQACGVDLLHDNASITSHDLAHLFAETMNSDEPEALNVGFILGVVDTLLRARKTYPRGW